VATYRSKNTEQLFLSKQVLDKPVTLWISSRVDSPSVHDGIVWSPVSLAHVTVVDPSCGEHHPSGFGNTAGLPQLCVRETDVKGDEAMDLNLFERFGHAMLARVEGPMKFRVVLQPCMALFLAIRGGVKDARECKPPYFWGLFTDKGEREAMLKDGWKAISRVFILGVVMDIIYQLIERQRLRIVEALVVAVILAIIPYLLFRGPVNRIICWREHKVAKERLAGD
jgi:hypothetical protein